MINEALGKDYPLDARVELMTSDGSDVEKEVTRVMGGGVILDSPAWKIINETRAKVLAEVQMQLTAKDEQLTAKDEQILSQKEQLTAKDELLKELKQRNAELEAMIRSLGGEI